MRDRFPPTSIIASAGSGKTYQLASRYLGLVSANAPVSSILATTFTRAAAGEIRDRVLIRLATAVDDDKERRQLAEAIGTGPLDRPAVLALLRTLTRQVHRMQVRTLDSFFAAVVRAFAIELGLPPDAAIIEETEEEELRGAAIARMLDSGDPLRFIELLRRLTRGVADRGITWVIDKEVKEMYGVYREADPAAWRTLTPRAELGAAEVRAAIERLAACDATNGHVVNALRADAERARVGDWEAFLTTGVARSVATSGTYRRKPIDEDLRLAYEPLVEHARATVLNALRERTTATADLLALFDEHARAEKHARRALTFSDLTASMNEAVRLGRFDDLCFRIDAVVQHLLLDEFQDTSVPQWQALEPIAREILGDESRPRTLLCVGDVKQSIYGFRDACPELLDELPKLLTGADGESVVQEKTLAKSYRSSPIIIETVNRIFESLDGNAAVGESVRAVEAFSAGFKRHTTARTESGYAELRTAPRAGPGEDQTVVRLRAAAALAETLHETAPHRSIAILTRSNPAVARLLFELSEQEVPASGRGGGPLTDATPVNVVLDALTLADHPDDLVAAFHVARSPLGPVLELPFELTNERAAARRHQVSRAIRRRLFDDGYAATIAAWAAALASDCEERELRRLLQLVEVAGGLDARAPGRADEVVRFVENHKVAEVQPAPVQVMTIHQAKGLEFDIVILPELDTGFTAGRPPSIIVERAAVGQTITRVCRYVSKKTVEALPELRPMFEANETRLVREALCLLYVAVTRPKRGLYMIIDPPPARQRTMPKSPAGLLRSALVDEDRPEPDQVVFTDGDDGWLTEATPPAREPAPAAPPPAAFRLTPASSSVGRGVGRGLVLPPASDETRTPGTTLARLLRVDGDERRELGSVLHALFEQIAWLDEWTPDPAALRRIARVETPRRAEAWHDDAVRMFLEALDRPAVRRAMTRGDVPEASLRVWTERPFVRVIGGRVQQGRIDRLVARVDAAGVARSATVIDLKSDAIDAADAAKHAEQYRGQLETYRTVAATALDLPPDAVDMVLLFIRPGVTVDLGDETPEPREEQGTLWGES